MTLNELKILLDIPLEDTSDDVRLALYLESGLQAAQAYCDRLVFLELIDPLTGALVLPGAVKLGIAEWVKANQEVSGRGTGVTSESVPGMSQSFESTDNASVVYSSAHAHWAPYHRQVRFLRARR